MGSTDAIRPNTKSDWIGMDYIRGCEMILVDGFIGNDSEFRVPARLIIERSNANVAGMQKHLYYPATEEEELKTFEPRLTIIYTLNLEMKSVASSKSNRLLVFPNLGTRNPDGD